MIQVLLLILKIIGITILAILGLILLVLLLVLFVPVFYRVRIIHNPDKTQVKARASFLFPLLLVTFQYMKKISYKVRIFGFALLDSDKPNKKKKPEKAKKQKKDKQKKEKVKKQKKKPAAETVQENVPEPVTEMTTEAAVQRKEPAEAIQPEEPAEAQAMEHKPEQPEKTGIFEKIKCKIQKIRETISNIIKKIKKLLHQKDEVQRILAKPETKQAISFAWDKLKRLLKHVLPRKIKGYVVYGADNPATTGQMLGVLSVVYARTGQLLEIRPNFEEKQLECDVELKGRVQVFTLLVIAVKVFINQELRQLISEFKRLKEIE